MINPKLKIKNQKFGIEGFTLVEILVVIAIIGILSTIGMVSYQEMQKRGRDAKRKQDLAQVQAALELYKVANGRYPVDTATSMTGSKVWVHSINELQTPKVYMQTLPKDPVNPAPTNCMGAYIYYYDIPNNTYTLFARLENINDPDAQRVKSPPPAAAGTLSADGKTFTLGNCGTAASVSGFNYWINNAK